MSTSHERIKAVEEILLGCAELRELFHPTEDYATYESMVSDSIDWALDNHEDERWTFEQSTLMELLYYNMVDIIGVPAATLHPIYDKLMEIIQ